MPNGKVVDRIKREKWPTLAKFEPNAWTQPMHPFGVLFASCATRPKGLQVFNFRLPVRIAYAHDMHPREFFTIWLPEQNFSINQPTFARWTSTTCFDISVMWKYIDPKISITQSTASNISYMMVLGVRSVSQTWRNLSRRSLVPISTIQPIPSLNRYHLCAYTANQ